MSADTNLRGSFQMNNGFSHTVCFCKFMHNPIKYATSLQKYCEIVIATQKLKAADSDYKNNIFNKKSYFNNTNI